jgi:hypothetical protein
VNRTGHLVHFERTPGPCRTATLKSAGCRLGLGPARRVVDQLAERFPAAAELLAYAAADLLAFTAYPKEHWRQPGPTNPQERLNGGLAERVYRPEVCLLQQDHIGTWGRAASRFGPVSQPVRTSTAPTARHAGNRLIKLPFGFGIFPFHQAGVHYRHRVELSSC